MFSQILDFISRFLGAFLPFTIVDPWCEGVVIFLGRAKRAVKPGLVWHLPFFTRVVVTPVVVQTIRPAKQTVTTKDGKTIVAAMVLRFTIDDVMTFITAIFEARDAIDDVAAGTLRLLVQEHTFDELMKIDLDNELSKAVRRELKKYGIALEQVTMSDFGQIRSLRLILDNTEPKISPN